MRLDSLTEELVIENKDELEVETEIEESVSGEYKTPHQGDGSGATTRPAPVGRLHGLWAGSGGLRRQTSYRRRRPPTRQSITTSHPH